jgi:hypothetical protein
MAIDQDPRLEQWYQHLDKGQRFKVVAIGEDEGAVEIQHFDGDLEELSLDEWYGLEIEPTETPEDWTGPVDDVERDDLGYTETDMEAEDWVGPLRENRRDKEMWEEDTQQGEDWEEDLAERPPGGED